MIVTRVEKLAAIAPAQGDRHEIFAFGVEASVDGPIDPASGMVVNLTELKERLRGAVVARLAGRVLDGSGGAPLCATPEQLARVVWSHLEGILPEMRLARVRLQGSPAPIVECHGPEGTPMDVTRVYEFSSSHRLHSPNLSDEENVSVFGKCNNPNGHGHNYVLEVTVRGEPGETGELIDAAAFDRVVEGEIVSRWDHKNLNEDVAEFRGVNPTAEEIARLAWRRLEGGLANASGAARLFRIKIRETERNHVEYFGD